MTAALKREIDALRQQITQSQSPWIMATISAADTAAQTADLTVGGGDQQRTFQGIPATGTYIPEVGHQVVVLMNGTAPMILPPAQPLTSAPPAQVSGVVVTGAIGGLLISWASITEADVKWNRGYYQVEVDTANTFATGNLIALDVAASSVVVSSLDTGTTYYVRVRAVDYVGTAGAYSSTVTGVPISVGVPDLTGIDLGTPIRASLSGVTPSSFTPASDVVFNSTDHKLYRWNGTTWIVSVATTDLSGTIDGTTQVTAHSITAASVTADTLTANEIASSAITTNELAAGAVTAAKVAAHTITANEIAALTITANEIVAATITGAKIAANTITAGNIVAATITATELAANSVTASQLAALNIAVGKYIRSTAYSAGVSGWTIEADGSAEFNNVTVRGTLSAGTIDKSSFISAYFSQGTFGLFNDITNPTFDTNASNWTAGANTTIARVTTPVHAGAGALRLTATGAGSISAISDHVSVSPGGQVSVSAWGRANATVRPFFLQVVFFNAGGTKITTWNGGNQGTVIATNDTTSYAQRTAVATAPPTTSTMAIQVTFTGAAASEIHYIDDVHVTGIQTGFCPDVDPLGTYTQAEGVGGSYGLPPGYVGIEGSSLGCQAITGGYPNLGGIIGVTAGQAYTITCQTTSIGGGSKQGVRGFAAWYTSAAALISVDKGIVYYGDATIATLVTADFLAPTNAAYAFFGVCVDPGIAATGGVLAASEVALYATTLIRNGFVKREVLDTGGHGPLIGSATFYLGPLSIRDEPKPGYLHADGRAVSRTLYAALFAEYGTFFGAGDGSTTFNLPDMRGRTAVSLDNQGGTDAGVLTMANTLGLVGGEESHQLTTAELAVHNHAISIEGSNYNGPDVSAGGNVRTVNIAGSTVNSQNAGSGTAHNNMQPYILGGWLIKC